MRLAGRYDVIGDLSAGGMGRLRLARAVHTGRGAGELVVIKTAHAPEDDERLRDEARVGMRLLHPHIVETLDLVDVNGRPGLVTAYVSGASLLDIRKKLGALPPALICRVGAQIAGALEAIHSACDEDGQPLLMLHRDVTASNIMLGHDGKARLIDLGIARSRENRAERTDAGSVRGTLRYLAPELFGTADHSPQTDLWSLGVVLWESLRGKEAMVGPSAACIGRILAGNVMSLDQGEIVDGRVQRAISHLLRISPTDRPKRARDAAALFAMLEKDIADSVDDVTGLMSSTVIAAVGPRTDDKKDPESAIVRANALFGEEARLQTTGMAKDDPNAASASAAGQQQEQQEEEVLLDVTEDDGAMPEVPASFAAPPGSAHGDGSDEAPKTPGQAILYYARLLQRLEARR